MRSARNVLATDQMGQIGELRGPGKLLQNAAQKQQASDVDGWQAKVWERRSTNQPRMCGIAAQLIERANGGMMLTEIDQKVSGRRHDTDGQSLERGRQ